MTFLYPVPDLAGVLRKVLTLAPEKLLFSTDADSYPGIPLGAEVQHASPCRSSRVALALALAGLVRDGVVDLETAVRMGGRSCGATPSVSMGGLHPRADRGLASGWLPALARRVSWARAREAPFAGPHGAPR